MDFHRVILLVIVALALRYGILGLRNYQERQKLAASDMAGIDGMDGKAFEEYLEVLFQRRGYQVERTPYVGDYGADLVVSHDGVKTAVQAKRYQRAVGIKAVQEAVAAKGIYGCTEAMVVTNSTFTTAAVRLAQANRVVLRDRTWLVNALLAAGTISQTAQVTCLSKAAKCEVCGALVSEKVGQFCLSRPRRFGGRIYCYSHQKGVCEAIL